ncbi:glycosyltransferase family 2 protein [Pseudomonadales bacterium]|nr:glycosyltransferase family 2 protein [Pseudomonadales bacterium]
MPLFSIVIPTYNRANALQHCLQALKEQSFKDFEVLVCDDGSEDNTKEVVESYRDKLDLKYYWQENWGGPAKPRNLGIRASEGEWICFLDSDDWFYPEKLQEVAKVLVGVDFIYHGLDYYNESYEKVFTPKVKVANLKKNHLFVDLLCSGNIFANSSVVVRKSIVVEAQGLSEDKKLIAVEDLDLWLKISLITNRFRCISKSLGGYYIGGDNLSQHSDKQMDRLAALYNKHLPSLPTARQRDAQTFLMYTNGITQIEMSRVKDARKSFLFAFTKSRMNSLRIKACLRYFLSFISISPKKAYMKLFRAVE